MAKPVEQLLAEGSGAPASASLASQLRQVKELSIEMVC